MNALFRTRTQRDKREPAPSAAERRARNLALCEELIETGMTLARAAADRALDDIAAPPRVAAIPGSSAGAIAQAQDEARRRGPDYGKLFTHISRAVRQTMLLETYLSEGLTPQPGNPITQTPQETRAPNLAPLHQHPNPEHPHHEHLRRETLERLESALPAGPDNEIVIETLLHALGLELGLDLETPPDNGRTEHPDPAPPFAAPKILSQDRKEKKAHRR